MLNDQSDFMLNFAADYMLDPAAPPCFAVLPCGVTVQIAYPLIGCYWMGGDRRIDP